MFVHVVIRSSSKKAAYQPFSKVLIEECELICTDAPENNTCFCGGILQNLHEHSYEKFKVPLPDHLVALRDCTEVLQDMKNS